MALSIGELVGYVDLDTSPGESALDSFQGKLGGFSSKGAALLGGAGLAMGAAFAGSLVSAINIEPANDRVAAGLLLSEDQAERSGNVAGSLYADAWGSSMEDVSGAVEAVMSSIDGMRDASEADLQDMTERALTFSTAMGVDVGRAAQVAGQMVRTGLADNAEQAFDLLTKASSQVPVQLREDVLDATDEYGQFFTQLGIDGPQAMGMLAKGAERGMYGIDKAGDAVKEFTIRATDMSETSKGAYEAIGLDAGKMAEDILAGGDRAKEATDKIVTGLLGIKDPAERANASIALFGTPLEDLSTKDIPTFLKSLQSGKDSLGDFKGATDQAGDTLNDNAKTNLTEFTRQLQTGFVDLLGGQVLPKVTEWSGVLSDNLGPAVKSVTGFLGDHTGAIKAGAVALGALLAVTKVHAAVLAVQSAGGLLAFLKGTKLITTATKTWTAVQWAMNAALTANPIGIVIAILAALAVAVVIAWKKSDTFRRVATNAFEAIATAGKWLWNKVLQPVFRALVEGLAWIMDKWGDMLDAMSHIPGFGWASKAADAMHNAADKARDLARDIRKIPDKDVFVRYHETTIRSVVNKQAGQADHWGGARAVGGPVQEGLTYLVGENGPELWTAPANGRIIPHNQLNAAALAGNRPAAHRPPAPEDRRSSHDRQGPLIGQVVQRPDESADELAERLWFKTRTRG